MPIVALLQEIRTQLPGIASARRVEEARRDRYAVGVLSLDDLTKKIGLQAATVKTIQETGEKWEQENLATSLPAQMIRAHLDHALGQLLGLAPDKPRRHAYRLVVLVDDLDRCEPDAAFKLLEGIKIYLNLPSCIFVLGMNQWIIERIAKQLKAESSDEDQRYVAANTWRSSARTSGTCPPWPMVGRRSWNTGSPKCSPESVGAPGHQNVSLPARQSPEDQIDCTCDISIN